MNPVTEHEAISLISSIAAHPLHDKDVETVIAPPFPFLSAVREVLVSCNSGTIKLGAQDVFAGDENTGAHTGEVSATQLKDMGVSYVIVGHSERRAAGETNEEIGKKLVAVSSVGMTPVLCISALEELETINHDILHDGLIIAYEPLWAIGSGTNDTPEHAAEIAERIKQLFSDDSQSLPMVLYGGSVTSDNAEEFLHRGELDGLLVGGASLNADMFINIITRGN